MKTFSEEQVTARANAIRRDKICGFKKAVEIAAAVEEIIEKMQHQTVAFSYIRQDGKTMHVKGTLTLYEKHFKRKYIPCPDNIFVLFFDTEIESWRTFHAAELLTGSSNPTPEEIEHRVS